jgi:hypothetical protein
MRGLQMRGIRVGGNQMVTSALGFVVMLARDQSEYRPRFNTILVKVGV